MKRAAYTFIVSLFLCGCATLTKTQIESVNQFGQTTKNFSAFPSKIMVELADIRFKRGLYYANTLTDSKLHIGELDDIYNQRLLDYEISDKVDITFKIIDKYAQSLVLLSSDKYTTDLEKQAKNFGVDIDTLIALNNSIKNSTKVPTGIGNSIGKLVVLGGDQFIKTKQAKEIKKFMTAADTLITVMTGNLIEYLESKNIQELITGEEREIARNYLSFLQQTPRVTIENERDYMELKSNIHEVKELQKQTLEATKSLRAAHKKLVQVIKKKKDLKECIKELQGLYEEVKDLKETVQKIETNK